MIKVSVIVPVYNGEKYIDRCIQCLLQQTLTEIEIIAVNDCSTDNSKSCLDKWALQYPDKISVISSERNRGAGGARNLGLVHAKGEYVGYMDCDDIVDATMFEKLYEKAVRENCDVVDSGYLDEKNNQYVAPWEQNLAGELNAVKRSEIICGVGYAVTKIFRREFLVESGIKIRENVIYEDLDFLIKVVMAANSIGVVYEVLYQYTNNEQSSSNVEKEQKKFDDMLAVIKEVSAVNCSEVESAIDYVIINCYVAAIGQCLFNQENQAFALVDNLKQLKSSMKNATWKDWKNNPYVKAKMPQENVELIEWFIGLRL